MISWGGLQTLLNFRLVLDKVCAEGPALQGRQTRFAIRAAGNQLQHARRVSSFSERTLCGMLPDLRSSDDLEYRSRTQHIRRRELSVTVT